MLGRIINCRLTNNLFNGIARRYITNESVTKKRNAIFEEEKNRQRSIIKRIEKIEVQYKDEPEECTLIMNKGLSTPYNCAMHMKEFLMTRSVLALVNGQPWDMHKPLEGDCDLKLLHFRLDDPELCNQAYWRSCSFVLGYVLERAFKPDHYIELCSFPKPDIKSGSFVYDVDIHMDNWKPNNIEKSCLSRVGGKLKYEDMKFERLEVDASLALKMFEDNRFKVDQIPVIAAQSNTGSSVTLYRLGDHVDISKGPLISNSDHIGQYSVTAVHDIESPDYGKLSRFQGISVPKYANIHFYTYDMISRRSERLNKVAPIPIKPKQKVKSSQDDSDEEAYI